MKRIEWLGTSLNAVRDFPQDARTVIGQELQLVQAGFMPTDFKPMPTVGAGAYEIRVRVGKQYRMIYVAKFSDHVYVLHAFIKKTPKTAKPDLDIAKNHYAALMKRKKS
ncbi:MAG: type II toxin-antitoxin system RelE/ParE family toxin [Betaproteobacteria bacterium]